jgi:HEAT repeats/Putative zinc-finger
MICERVKEQLAEYLSGNLEGPAREKFVDHLEQCPRCQAEVEELGALWRGLEFVPSAQPGIAMRGRFNEMLEAYRFGQAEALQQAGAFKGEATPTNVRQMPQPRHAWWQLAAACGLLAAGAAAGRFTVPQHTTTIPTPEVAQLRGEVESMRQLVTLSLLQQQSAGQRLRGVTYSYQMDRADPEVEKALLFAVSHDANVNVRLSAVDALQKFAHNPQVTKSLVDAIEPQDSPLVQIALIDLLVDAKEGSIIPELRKLEKAEVNEAVRQRATWGLQKLGVI